MSIPDNLMEKYFELITDVPAEEYQEILAGHPRDAKLRLAMEITTMLHDAAAAEQEKNEFLSVFAAGNKPADMPQIQMPTGDHKVLEVIATSQLLESSSEARRMIQQGAVKWNDEKITDVEASITVTDQASVLQIGKRKFCEVASVIPA